MKGIEYSSRSTARRRLLNTAILVDGEVAFVEDVVPRRTAQPDSPVEDLQLVPGQVYGRRRYLNPEARTFQELSRVEREYYAVRITETDHFRERVRSNNRLIEESMRRRLREEAPETGLWNLIVRKYTEEGRSSEVLEVPMSDDRVDLAPFRLGYTTIGEALVYLRRSPGATYTQGLHARNVRVEPVPSSHDFYEVGHRTFGSPSFIRMVKGIYDPFEECVRKLELPDAPGGLAFTRDLAVVKTDMGRLGLYYKGKMIADTEKHEDGFRLGPRFFFMKEELMANGVKINDAA